MEKKKKKNVQLAEEIIAEPIEVSEETKKLDEQRKRKEEKPKRTFEGKVNKYGFLHFGKPLMEAWQLSKGTEQPVTIELTPEGALVIRKT